MKKEIYRLIAVLTAVNTVFSSAVFAEETGKVNADEPSAEQEISVSDNTETQAENGVRDETDSALLQNAVNLYVDPNGSGENTYSSITRAISAARSIDKTKNQVIINVKGGTYRLNETIALEKKDSGSSEYPMIIKAEQGKQVIFNAGRQVTGEPLKDSSIKNKIPKQAREKVYKIDLSELKDLGNPDAVGAHLGSTETSAFGSIIELIFDDTAMPRATYPNAGSEYISRVIAADSESVQYTVENEKLPVSSWDLKNGTGWSQSIASWGYDYGQNRLLSYDSASKSITAKCDASFVPNAGTRVRYKNLPEFIDQPGEYSVDFTKKCIYFYPPDEKMAKPTYVTSFKEPLLKLSETSNIIIDGIIFENGGNDGVVFESTDNCALKNCTVRNVSGIGVRAKKTANTTIDNCSVNNVGLQGIVTQSGGAYKTLTSSGNVIENCDIYTVGRTAPVGSLGIMISYETGTKVLNNRIHDTPHDAIRLVRGTACTVEGNEIYNAVNDTYDAGAIYTGTSMFEGVGNIFKYNYIHDIYRTSDSKGGSVVGLYWDDQCAGQTAYGNIFDDVAFGMLVGGGDWDTVNNNLFYKSRTAGTVDARGEGWQKATSGGGYVQVYENEVGTGNALWNEKYPYTKKFYEYAKNNNMEKICAPDELTLTNNIYIETPQFTLAESAEKNALAIENNKRIDGSEFGFEDADNYNFNYSKDAAVANFDYIDFSKIGIAEKNLGKPQLLGPVDGAKGIEGSNAVLSWKDSNGADRYRVKIAMQPDMKVLVYDEVVKGKSVLLENLKYAKTYYWTVEPVVSSKSENGGYTSDIHSFSTASSETKDTSELNELLTSLGNGWRRVAEGKRPGMYQEGAIAELDKAVTEAETVYYDSASKMFTVRQVTAKLRNAINRFNDKLVYETVEFGDWMKDGDNWVTENKSAFNGKTVHLYSSGGDYFAPNAGYKASQLSRGQMLKFKVKLDLANYQMWGFNAESPEGYAWGNTGYSIIAKRDMFEVQKRYKQNGNTVAQIIKTFVNEESIMTSNVWHTVEMGVLSTVQGPRILMKVDGKTAVDYIDNSGEPADQLGYFIFTEQSGGIGMEIAPSDYTE